MYCRLLLIYTRCDWLQWMEDRETARMRKYGESKTTRIMMATVPHVISGLGLRKFQADGFLMTREYVGRWTHSTTALPRQNGPPGPLNRWLGGSQRLCKCLGEVRNLMSLQRMEPHLPGCPARILATTPNRLSSFHVLMRYSYYACRFFDVLFYVS